MFEDENLCVLGQKSQPIFFLQQSWFSQKLEKTQLQDAAWLVSVAMGGALPATFFARSSHLLWPLGSTKAVVSKLF